MRELTPEQRDVVERVRANMAKPRTASGKPRTYRRKQPVRRRGPSRCSWCLELGHDARVCPVAPPDRAQRHRDPAHRSDNAGYQANRRAGLCDNCGAHSPDASLCQRCTLARKLRPSRQPAYVKAHRGDRTAEYERRNRQRRKASRA